MTPSGPVTESQTSWVVCQLEPEVEERAAAVLEDDPFRGREKRLRRRPKVESIAIGEFSGLSLCSMNCLSELTVSVSLAGIKSAKVAGE